MRVLHVLSSDDEYGSAKSFMELLTIEQQDEKITPFVIIPRENKIYGYCKENNIWCGVISYGPFQIPKHDNWALFILKFIYHLFGYLKSKNIATKKIENVITEQNIDVVHTNSSIIDVGAVASRKTMRPHVWHIREYGKEDFNFYPIRRNYIDFMNQNTDGFIFISQALKSSWERKGLDCKNSIVISHGVNSKSIVTKDEYSESSQLKAVMTGSFSRGKGQIVLIEALKLLTQNDRKNIHVDFFGKKEGNYYDEVFKAAISADLTDTVCFQGYSDMIGIQLKNYDIGIICSKSEAMGRTTIEYMMAGICPIVSHSGANVELVEDNKCGICFEEGNAESLARVLSNAIKNKNLINEYGNRSKLIAKEKYDIEKNAFRIIDFFEKCCNE